MRKVLITTVTLDYGGAERVAVNLANEISKKKFQVTLLVLKSNGPLDQLVFEKVNLVHLHIKRLKFGLWTCYKFLKDYSPDIVISNMRNANIVVGVFAKFFGFERVVLREATTFTGLDGYSWLKRFLYLKFLSFAYSSSRSIISNSSYTAKELERLKIAPSEKVTVIGNPVIEKDQFLKDKEKRVVHKWLNDKHLEVILYVGRLHAVKNLKNLILAFQAVNILRPNLRLILLGEGDEKSSLSEIIIKNKLKNKVDIVPFTDNPLPFYKHCSAFVLASKWEGFGNVLVEAIGCGAPVIVNNCPGGAVELAQKSSLYKITNSNDIKQFSFDIEQFLMKLNGRRQPKGVCDFFIENYNSTIIAEQYLVTLGLNKNSGDKNCH